MGELVKQAEMNKVFPASSCRLNLIFAQQYTPKENQEEAGLAGVCRRRALPFFVLGNIPP
jgi:hypothetical protein